MLIRSAMALVDPMAQQDPQSVNRNKKVSNTVSNPHDYSWRSLSQKCMALATAPIPVIAQTTHGVKYKHTEQYLNTNTLEGFKYKCKTF